VALGITSVLTQIQMNKPGQPASFHTAKKSWPTQADGRFYPRRNWKSL